MTSVPNCDPDLYDRGETIAILQGPRTQTIEDYIVRVRARSEQRVDWHFVGGIARVVFIGDRARVRNAMESEWPSLVGAYMKCSDNWSQTPKPEDVWIKWRPS